MHRSDPAYRGQADYSPLLLRLYDPIVIGVVAGLVWRFPANRAAGWCTEPGSVIVTSTSVQARGT